MHVTDFSQTSTKFRVMQYAPLERHARHAHDGAQVTLVLSGAIEEGSHAGTCRARSFGVLVKPPGVYHEDEFHPAGTRTFQLAIESTHVDEYYPQMAYRWYEGGLVARAMLDALRLAREDKLADEAIRDACVMDVLASLAASPTSGRGEPRWMRDVRDYLDETTGESVSIRKLADDTRMHPVSLARAFRRHHGCSITEYIRRRRVVDACRMFEDQTGSLADVAAASGFADQPHFTRAFRRETGVTPRRFQRLTA